MICVIIYIYCYFYINFIIKVLSLSYACANHNLMYGACDLYISSRKIKVALLCPPPLKQTHIPTPSVSLTQIGKSPDISETHSKSNGGKKKLGFVSPGFTFFFSNYSFSISCFLFVFRFNSHGMVILGLYSVFGFCILP